MVASCGACSASPDLGPAAEVTDSAGVRIVTYDLTDAAPPTYRALGEPDLDIGTVDGPVEYAFSRIDGVAVADDGSIVVADGSARELRVYDGAGVFRRALGRPGEGPGEFAGSPQIAGLAGDTVFAYDLRTRRVTAFGLGGDLRGSLTLATDVQLPVRVVRLEDGALLLQSRWISPVDPGLYDFRQELDSAVIERLDRSGALLDTFAVLPDVRRVRRVSQRADGAFSTVQADTPFSPRAVFVKHDRDVLYAHTGTFEVRRAGADGSDVVVIRVLGAEDRTPMSEVRARQEAAMREQAGGNPEMDELMWLLNVESLPERLPAFRDLLVSETGDVWISRMEFDRSDGDEWLVFAPSGELRGAVHAPRETELFTIGADYAIGAFTDDLEVPYVRRFPLLDPPPAS